MTNHLERIYKLIELLSLSRKPLTKEEIFHQLKEYYNQENEDSKNRQFERDKKLIQELGFSIIKTYVPSYYDEYDKPAYIISDVLYKENILPKLKDIEKEKLSKILLDYYRSTKDKNVKKRIFILYFKIFINDDQYLNKFFEKNEQTPLNILKEFNTDAKIHNQNNLKKIIEIFHQASAIEIEYTKKNGEQVKRNVYPLMLYNNKAIDYLLAYDYDEQEDSSKIKNFILNNIQKIKKLNSNKFKPVKINPDIVTIVEDAKKTIQVPLKYIYLNLPHPFFIKKTQKNPIEIQLTIKKQYMSKLKDFLKTPKLPFKMDFYSYVLKIVGETEEFYTISLKLYNLDALFRFLSLYPDILKKIDQKAVLEDYKKYLKEVYEFYQT